MEKIVFPFDDTSYDLKIKGLAISYIYSCNIRQLVALLVDELKLF